MTDRPPAFSQPPFSHSFDLASLGESERTIALKPNATERAAMAKWAGIDALNAFSASVRLRHVGDDLYEYEASFNADVTQACVVTLGPVHAHLEGSVARLFRVVVPPRGRRRAPPAAPIEVVANDDDETEKLTSGVLDLAGPLLEEFVLAIDPYPRAPGAVFEAPSDQDKAANPFSALEALKHKG